MKFRILNACGMVVLVAATLSANGLNDGAYGQEITIRYASPSSLNDPTQEATVWFMDQVEERTDGRVRFETFLGQALVRDQDTLDAVGQGLVEMAKIYTAVYPGQLPLFNIGNLPFTHPAPYVAINVMHGLLERFPELSREMETLNVTPLGVLSTGGTELVSRREVRSLDDLKDLRVRARGVHALAFTAIGASPAASIPWNDTYEALSRGVIDASTNYVITTRPIRHNEVTDYFIKVGLGQAVQAEIVNLDFWNSLPKDIQEIMEETMREAEERYFQRSAMLVEAEIEAMTNAEGAENMKFLDFDPSEREKWIEQSPDFFADWAEENSSLGDTEAMAAAFRELSEKFVEKGEELGVIDMW